MDLPPDQKAELFHALLYRKGLRTIRGQADEAQPTGSLRDRAQAIFDMRQE